MTDPEFVSISQAKKVPSSELTEALSDDSPKLEYSDTINTGGVTSGDTIEPSISGSEDSDELISKVSKAVDIPPPEMKVELPPSPRLAQASDGSE